MNALKTLHGSIATRHYERLADYYHTSKISYEAEEVFAKFKEREGGWVELSILHYYNNGELRCFLRRYTDRRGTNSETLLAEGSPEDLEAAIDKLIEGKKA